MAFQINAALLTAFQSSNPKLGYLVDLYFDSGQLSIWTGYGPIDINGITYTGTGDLLQIEAVEETSEIVPSEMRLILSGLNASMMSLVLSETYQNRRGVIQIADPDQLDAAIIFDGFIDSLSPVARGDALVIECIMQNEMAKLDRAPVKMISDDYLQEQYPGDIAFSFIPNVASV